MSLSSNKLLIQAICEKTALEVLNTHVVLLKQYTEIGVNWLIAIGNKAKANIQITNSYLKLHTNKIIYIIPMKFIQVYTFKRY